MRISKTIVLTLLFFCGFISFLDAQNVGLDWVRSVGGIDRDVPYVVTTDDLGNVYIAGEFTDTVDFDPGPGVYNMWAGGYYAHGVFILKLDSLGNFVWAKSFGNTTNSTYPWEIKVDNLENVYITGSFRFTVDFDPGVGIVNLTSKGVNDIFIMKLNSQGIFSWVNSYGCNNIGGWTYHVEMELGDMGNIFLSGSFQYVVDFDSGPGVVNIDASGGSDVFIMKLNPLGDLIWVKSFGGFLQVENSELELDSYSNIIMTGLFQDTLDVDPSGGVFNLVSNGGRDIFVLKLDSAGNFLWANSTGGSIDDWSTGLAIDLDGNIITGGNFRYTLDANPGIGVFNITSVLGLSFYIQKLDPMGGFLWAVVRNDNSWPHYQTLRTDNNGSVFAVGSFRNTIDFDPGPGVFNLTEQSAYGDTYLQKLDSMGDFEWAISFGGDSGVSGISIEIDTLNSVYLIGGLLGTVDFDPSTNVVNSVSNGASDINIVKLNPCYPNTGIDTVFACDSLTWIDGVTYTANNSTATYVLANISGCDSIVTLDLTLTFNASSSSTDVITACNNYTWINGINYTSSNNSATYTLGNAAGCDSVITLDLTIIPESSSTDTYIECDSLIWIDGNVYTSTNDTSMFIISGGGANGCDSIVHLDLQIVSTDSIDVVTACNSYTWTNGVTYFESSDTATIQLTNQLGCDSVIRLDLTIDTVNTNISQQGLTIAALAQSATFQWINCVTNTLIPNEDQLVFEVTQSGSYAVEVTQNGCVDTSNCITFINVGFESLMLDQNIKVYPNPTKDFMNIEFEELNSNSIKVVVFDYLGRKVIENSLKLSSGSTIYQVEMSNLTTGIYFVKVFYENKESLFKISKL